MSKKHQSDGEMLKGTLDMMILRTLVTGDAHGHTIAKVIERTSENVLEVEQGSLYPALHRLEDRGWVTSYWGASENNRKAKFYRLTAAGRKQLVRETSRWRQMTRAIGLVMGEEARRWRRRMSWLSFFRRGRADAELQEEIEALLAEETADNIARGMRAGRGAPPGTHETWQSAEACANRCGGKISRCVDTVGRDLRYALALWRARRVSR